MTATLSHLSSEILGSVLDLVDANSLMRLLLLGNEVLNTKLYGSVTHFVYTVERTRARALWPKILSRFRALTHVSVSKPSSSYYTPHVVVQEVNLMALPETLRVLELNFANSLFCLLKTLPRPNAASFAPRLRTDLQRRFKHLERMSRSSAKKSRSQHDVKYTPNNFLTTR